MNLPNPLKLFACLFILFLTTATFFIYTVHIRQPWFGAMALENHHVATAASVQFAQYWYNESPLDLKFGMFYNPPSIEFPTLASRNVYISFSPVAIVVPIYLISKIMHHEPTVEMAMAYNLANHFFLSLFLSWIAFFFCVFSRLPLLTSLIFAVIPVVISQLMPMPLFFYQNVYWSDQVVLPLIALFILIELLRDNILDGKKNKLINVSQALLLFLGVLVDWLFVIFAVVVFLKRVFHDDAWSSKKRFFTIFFKYWWPAAFAMTIYFFQVVSLNSLPKLIQRFMERTGSLPGTGWTFVSFTQYFWETHMTQGFGSPSIWLTLAILITYVFVMITIIFIKLSKRNLPRELVGGGIILTLLMMPCFIEIYFLCNHSAIHNLAALKFVIPIAVIPFVVIPSLIWTTWGQKYLGHKVHSACLAVIFLGFASTYTVMVHPGYHALFYKNKPIFKTLGEFIAKNTDYQDIVFSTQGGIDENPLYLAVSKKRVYMIRNVLQIMAFVKDLKRPYTINILTTNQPETDPGVLKLISMAFDVRHEGGLFLYKIRG